jgi:hypothetical protein
MPTYLLVSVGHFTSRSGWAPEHHQKNRFIFSMEQERNSNEYYYYFFGLFTKWNAALSNWTPKRFRMSHPRERRMADVVQY